MKWSEYFQNPLYLEMTRRFLIDKEVQPIICKKCNIKNGMKVLDVGCGTGFFTRVLAENSKIDLIGIDLETEFIKYANNLVKELNLDRIKFIEGNACELPFDNNSFDCIVSHTFFTSIKNPNLALEEMKRVCKPHGTIASITTMSFEYETSSEGNYPIDCYWYDRLKEIESKLWKMYQIINPISNYLNCLKTSQIPHFFSEAGLKQISIFPIGKAFSLSDASISNEDKEEYILNMYEADKQKIDKFMELDSTKKFFNENDYKEYISLLTSKRNFLLSNIGENSIWEWNGGCNILITGIVRHV